MHDIIEMFGDKTEPIVETFQFKGKNVDEIIHIIKSKISKINFFKESAYFKVGDKLVRIANHAPLMHNFKQNANFREYFLVFFNARIPEQEMERSCTKVEKYLGGDCDYTKYHSNIDGSDTTFVVMDIEDFLES